MDLNGITNKEFADLCRRHEIDVAALPDAFIQAVDRLYKRDGLAGIMTGANTREILRRYEAVLSQHPELKQEVFDVLRSAGLALAIERQRAEVKDEAIRGLRGRLKALEKEMHIDPLTELYTRAKFDMDVKEIVALYNEGKIVYDGQNGCWLIFMDVNMFKGGINDRYGHDAGDIVLEATGATLNQLTGTKGTREGGTAYRYGGDEFAVLLMGTYDSGIELAKKIQERFTGLNVDATDQNDKPIKIPVTLSIGLSYFPDDVSGTRTFDAWFKLADAAMYTAKAQTNGLRSVIEVARLR